MRPKTQHDSVGMTISAWKEFKIAALITLSMFMLSNASAFPGTDANIRPEENAQSGSIYALDAEARSNLSAQLKILKELKESRSESEKKLSSNLFLKLRSAADKSLAKKLPRLAAVNGVGKTGPADCNVKCVVTDRLVQKIIGFGGSIVSTSEQYGAIHAKLPVEAIDKIAADEDVRSIEEVVKPILNKANTSQGDVGHRAPTARSKYGVTGKGVKVGVMSDSVRYLSSVQAKGDLPAVSVLPGCDGEEWIEYYDESDRQWYTFRADTGEGTAMLEIVHDLAPGASLLFSSVGDTQEEFADRIDRLSTEGCKIIVDDITFLAEPAFQDGLISKSIAKFTDKGGIFFTAAGNRGNLDSSTSGTWEGDFKSSGWYDDNYEIHDFGNDVAINKIIPRKDSFYVQLQWSDPWGYSKNDYDLAFFNQAGDIVAASVDTQDGNDNPIEWLVYDYDTHYPESVGVTVLKYRGARARCLKVLAWGGMLNRSTNGTTTGHNADLRAISVAAASAQGRVFAASDDVESYSSDGPRKMFYDVSGNFLSGSSALASGGVARQKPDFAAAEGVSCYTPGFELFGGTSASAPHAAAIAALMLQANPKLTRDGVFNAMKKGTFSGASAKWDRSKGYGILDAAECVRLVSIPSAVKANASDGTYTDRVRVTWAAAALATSYDVYRSASSTGAKTKVGNTTGTFFDDKSTTVAFGKTYYYWVKAKNANGESAFGGSDTGWKKAGKYTVLFSANKGKGTMAAQSLTRNSSISLRKNAFKRSGYVFIGWAKSPNGAVVYANRESVLNVTAAGNTVTLYAVWAKKTYKVKFYANGGNGTMAVEKMTYGKAKNLSANQFTRDGCVFKGWAKSKTLANKGKVAYKDKKKVKNLVTNGKTVKLYAVWSEV